MGGSRNWDYRYTWMRDAAFTVYGFLRIGFTREAASFLTWMQTYATNTVAGGFSAATYSAFDTVVYGNGRFVALPKAGKM